jgi:hypothetical protein
MIAIENRLLSVAKLLIENGANLALRDRKQKTVFDYAEDSYIRKMLFESRGIKGNIIHWFLKRERGGRF